MVKPTYRGFTLWKLLVASVLLLIMAAVFFPMFARAPEIGGNRNMCPSNLKQIALGYLQYAQDYNEKLPPVGKVTSGIDTGWARALQPYLKSEQIFRCPASQFTGRYTDQATDYTSYYLNANFAAKSIAQINAPSEVAVCGEGERASSDYACSSLSTCSGSTASGAVGPVLQQAQERHEGGSYYALADGHVVWLRPKVILSNGNEKKLFGY